MITENTIQGRKYVKELTKELFPVVLDIMVEILFASYRRIGGIFSPKNDILQNYYKDEFYQEKSDLLDEYLEIIETDINHHVSGRLGVYESHFDTIIDSRKKTVEYERYEEGVYTNYPKNTKTETIRLKSPIPKTFFLILKESNGKSRGEFQRAQYKNQSKVEYRVILYVEEFLKDLMHKSFSDRHGKHSVSYNLVYGTEKQSPFTDKELKQFCRELVTAPAVKEWGGTFYHEIYHYYQQTIQYGKEDFKQIVNKPRVNKKNLESLAKTDIDVARYLNSPSELYAYTLTYYDKNIENMSFEKLIKKLEFTTFYVYATIKNKKKIKSILYSIAEDEGYV